MLNEISEIIEELIEPDLYSIINFLQERFGNIDLKNFQFKLKTYKEEKWSLLHFFANKGKLKECKMLIEEFGFDANQESKLKRTPLHFACINGYAELINYLLEKTDKLSIDYAKQNQFEYYSKWILARTDQSSDYLEQKKDHHLAIRKFTKFSRQLEFVDVLQLFQAAWDKHNALAKSIFRSLVSKIKQTYIVENEVKAHCPRKYVQTIAMPFITPEEAILKRNIALIERPYFLARLKSKHYPYKVKYEVDLGEEHAILRSCLSGLTGKGNYMVASITFLIKISNLSGGFIYHKETIPLLVPSNKGVAESLLNFDDIKTLIPEAYEELKKLYTLGLEALGCKKHGHKPCYEFPENKGQAQYIKHTEQAIAVFLSLSGSRFLLNQLIDRLRRNIRVEIGSSIKIISTFLQLHSSKTPCAVCESVLIGLKKQSDGFIIKLQRQMSLLTKEYVDNVPSRYFRFSTPKNGINLHILFSADNKDGDHKKHLHFKTGSDPSEISVKTNTDRLFCAVFNSSLPENIHTDIEQRSRSLFFSGGFLSDKVRKTKDKVKKVWNKEDIAGVTIGLGSLTLGM